MRKEYDLLGDDTELLKKISETDSVRDLIRMRIDLEFDSKYNDNETEYYSIFIDRKIARIIG